MGRIKLSIPTGNFTIRTKPNKNGEVSIYLVYTVDMIAVPRSTGIKIKLTDWDEKTQKVKTKNSNFGRLNNQLKLYRDKIDAQIREYKGVLTAQIIGNIIDGKYKEQKSIQNNIDFIQYAYSYNKQRYELQKVAYSTYYNASQYIKHFQYFITSQIGESTIFISDLTLDLFEKYKAERLKKGNTKEGINKMLTPLFKAVSYAKDNELISVKIASAITNSYFDLKQRKYSSEVENEDIHYLTQKQLVEFIEIYKDVKYDRTREIMEMFLFSFHACGLRVSDIITLEWCHIDWSKCEIAKNLFKGNVSHSIPLTYAALGILERWRRKDLNERFVFNLLPENFDLEDEAQLDMARKSKNRTLQMSLNALGEKLGLSFNLSMHVARHTFAVMALNRGVSLHMISKLLGHSSVITTEKVYAQLLPDTITEEVRSKLSFTELLPKVAESHSKTTAFTIL